VTPEQLTDEVWEYILGQGSFPSPAPLPREKADILKREFSYFYPMDIRSSGKDLVPNHLTFAIYNHAALFPEEQWPLSMRTNGHLMLNGKKMAKSTGNSLTLKQGVEKFGADATRIALADAGDSIEDANFDEKTANASILRLHTLVGWCTVRAISSVVRLRTFLISLSRKWLRKLMIRNRASEEVRKIRLTTAFSRMKLTT
jgi:leucyl-tRNA synthetase